MRQIYDTKKYCCFYFGDCVINKSVTSYKGFKNKFTDTLYNQYNNLNFTHKIAYLTVSSKQTETVDKNI